MRFNITLQLPDRNKNILPVNYQYEFSSWIYHTIHNANPVFSTWLHNEGYTTGTQRFKFFTFSNLQIPHGGYKVVADRMSISSESCSMQVSFLIGDAAVPFITGVFQNQDFSIGDAISRVRFRVSTIERMPDPVFDSHMTFSTLSPLVIGKSRLAEGGKGTAYLSPADTDFQRFFFQNLARKVSVIKPEAVITENVLNTCRFDLLDTPRSKIIQIKTNTSQTTYVKGYLSLFRLTAPSAWIETGYFSGFGEKNSLGMGCVKTILES